MSTLQKDDLLQKRGQDLYDQSGEKIGKIEEIYLDADTGAPEWALVNTGLFGTKSTFVPLRDASEDAGNLRVPYEKAQVKDAPKMDPDGELSQQQEGELYGHYGLDYSESRSDSGLPEGGAGASADTGTTGTTGTGTDRTEEAGTVGHDTSGPTTDQAMTRSEEELHVGKTQPGRGPGGARRRRAAVGEGPPTPAPGRGEEGGGGGEPITDANVGDAT